jgi:hypothetical protein
MVNGYAQTSEKIALSKLLGGRVLAPLRAALSFSPSPPSRAPGAQNFLDLVSNTNAHAARRRTRTRTHEGHDPLAYLRRTARTGYC